VVKVVIFSLHSIADNLREVIIIQIISVVVIFVGHPVPFIIVVIDCLLRVPLLVVVCLLDFLIRAFG
jgi:hypothetical protein